MDVKIRHKSDGESIALCKVNRPGDVEGVVKELARAGGVIIRRDGKERYISISEPTNQLHYEYVLTEKEFFAEIVVHTDEAKEEPAHDPEGHF